ncbi:MAG: hypothetical protein CVU11_11055 [Bacteroidetes bacterium HGW-Bacteroidetes-6]|jgi:hypothetical protein|nr:MAG: hypothetical protein CVU11_11055 [Bacteroidetes bacterium HGW-Bacteroidetes-6]
MKHFVLSTILLFIFWFAKAQIIPGGYAEDNWGNRIAIDDSIQQKTTVIIPFSTSNCGYCLVDGYFTETNYIEANTANGGASFHQCLFNPQLDIYAFTKHFGWKNPVLTYPPVLYNIHKGGFPNVLAFKNGKQVIQDYYNYDNYPVLKKALWDSGQYMIPTGNLRLANNFIWENENFDAVVVFPQGSKKDSQLEDIGNRNKSFTCKNVDSLSSEDLRKNLMLVGQFSLPDLADFFIGQEIPLQFSDKNLIVGNYSFPFDSVGIYIWFTNPFNPEKYILLDIGNGNRRIQFSEYLDFIVYSGSDSLNYKKLMYGQYDVSDGKSRIVPEKTFSDTELEKHCFKQCSIPLHKNASDHIERYETIPVARKITENGEQWTISSANCRFPDITTDADNNIWVTYEENGDIILLKVDSTESHYIIESDESDSYNPIVVSDKQRIWVFYLNNEDSYYRLYARFLENNNLSDKILISGKEPIDVNIINAASLGNEISIAWCEWKANLRFLQMCTISNGTLGNVLPINLAPSQYAEGYSNAWYPSLCYFSNGELWGAWNQHYPGNFCIIGGKIGEMPQPVTLSAKKMDDWETGGYPCIFNSRNGEKSVVYESNGWDVIDKKAQTIKISIYNEELKKWSIGSVISDKRQTLLNETPVAVSSNSGQSIVVWSGRPESINSVWGIYISINSGDKWSHPILISEKDITSRHPQIVYQGETNSVWISWHSGNGENMKTEVIEISLNKFTGN